MPDRQQTQFLRTVRSECNDDFTPVFGVLHPLDEPQCFRTVDEANDAVVAELHVFRELPDSGVTLLIESGYA